jgi:glycerol-3-phosphate dehydrogenase (NAD(P)+)
MMRLGIAMGADVKTLMGLSGVGDLILTCTDDQSRNRRMGLALGRGDSIEQARKRIGQTVEGLRTASEVHQLANKFGVEMPICEQVYRLVQGEADVREALHNLMLRARKSEF